MAGGGLSIRPAETAADYAAFGALLVDYIAWCRARHADDGELVERIFGEQEFAAELPALATCYGPPNGRTLLAVDDAGGVVGCGAWHRLADGSCEMKRVFVTDRLQSRGLGRRLCQALIDDAGAAGFATLRLDTLRRFTEAIALYETLGFRRCAPHHDYPADIAGLFVFMERSLDGRLDGRRQGD